MLGQVQRFLVVLSFFVFGSVSALAEMQRDPMGETADYALDKNGARTSSLITKGFGEGIVDQFLPNHENGPSYGVLVSYELVVKLQGTKKGSMRFIFPDEYFTPQFMPDLRKNGTFETSDYKMKHEGMGSTTTLDGGDYKDCDKVMMYDIKDPDSLGFSALLAAAAGYSEEDLRTGRAEIQDLVIRTYIHPSVKVLGAAKLDISGKVSGVSVKVGLDYKRP